MLRVIKDHVDERVFHLSRRMNRMEMESSREHRTEITKGPPQSPHNAGLQTENSAREQLIIFDLNDQMNMRRFNGKLSNCQTL